LSRIFSTPFGLGGKNGKMGTNLLDHWQRPGFLRIAHALGIAQEQEKKELERISARPLVLAAPATAARVGCSVD
jgi:hypothetical protein